MQQRNTFLRLMLVVVIGLVSLLSCTSCTTVSPKKEVSLETISLTTGYIEIQDSISCSGTVVGKHTILTAAHCFHDLKQPLTDFKFRDKVVKYLKGVEDSEDHLLIETDQTFDQVASVDLAYTPVLGESFYYWGAPQGWPQIFRRCYFTGKSGNDLIMDSNVWFGDSGAGMFDHDGNVIAVVNFLTGDQAHRFRLEGSTPFSYTSQQWAEMGVSVIPPIVVKK